MAISPRLRALAALRREVSDWRRWLTRGLVIAFAALSGLVVVGFTWLSERALHAFQGLLASHPLWVWLWTPALTGGLVWATRRWAPGAAGSGIPQVMAALEPAVDDRHRGLFVSLRLSLAKVVLTTGGLLAGLSTGREGPSVQIAAGVMHAARRWLPERNAISAHGLLVAGGAAGIAAAFNTPLAGVMFAIEELSRRPEQRNSGLLIAGIVLAGLVAVSVGGNGTYFGVLRVPAVGWDLLGPGLLVALACGLAGGLFARLLIDGLTGAGGGAPGRWRARHPVRFAAGCGLAVATIGAVSHGSTFGSGYLATRALLDGSGAEPPSLYPTLEICATWLSAWSGVPGGIFAPSLSIGAALGHDIARLTGHPHTEALIALGMAGFLAAVTRAPLTAFIIVMEMVDGHALVLTLMACALVSSAIARVLTPPLYATLAAAQLGRLPARPPPAT